VSCAKAGSARRKKAPAWDSLRVDKCGLRDFTGRL
jgi:hypothetical protein